MFNCLLCISIKLYSNNWFYNYFSVRKHPTYLGYTVVVHLSKQLHRLLCLSVLKNTLCLLVSHQQHLTKHTFYEMVFLNILCAINYTMCNSTIDKLWPGGYPKKGTCPWFNSPSQGPAPGFNPCLSDLASHLKSWSVHLLLENRETIYCLYSDFIFRA